MAGGGPSARMGSALALYVQLRTSTSDSALRPRQAHVVHIHLRAACMQASGQVWVGVNPRVWHAVQIIRLSAACMQGWTRVNVVVLRYGKHAGAA